MINTSATIPPLRLEPRPEHHGESGPCDIILEGFGCVGTGFIWTGYTASSSYTVWGGKDD